MIKGTDNTTPANIILNGWKLNTFPLRLGIIKGYLLPTFLCYNYNEGSSQGSWQDKDIKGTQIRKEEVVISIHRLQDFICKNSS